MDINSAASSISTMSLANVQAQASISMFKKALDLQQSTAAQLLQALPAPAQPVPGTSVGTRVDTYV